MFRLLKFRLLVFRHLVSILVLRYLKSETDFDISHLTLVHATYRDGVQSTLSRHFKPQSTFSTSASCLWTYRDGVHVDGGEGEAGTLQQGTAVRHVRSGGDVRRHPTLRSNTNQDMVRRAARLGLGNKENHPGKEIYNNKRLHGMMSGSRTGSNCGVCVTSRSISASCSAMRSSCSVLPPSIDAKNTPSGRNA